MSRRVVAARTGAQPCVRGSLFGVRSHCACTATAPMKFCNCRPRPALMKRLTRAHSHSVTRTKARRCVGRTGRRPRLTATWLTSSSARAKLYGTWVTTTCLDLRRAYRCPSTEQPSSMALGVFRATTRAERTSATSLTGYAQAGCSPKHSDQCC